MIRFHADAHPAGLASLFLGLPVMEYSRAQSSAAGIQASGDNRDPFRQPRLRRSFRSHMPGHSVTGHDIGKKMKRYAEVLSHFLIP